MSAHWMVLDFPYLMWRSFYSRGNREAIPALIHAIEEVQTLGEKFGSTEIAFTFDFKPYYRKSIFKGYKASRDKREVDEETRRKEDDVLYCVDRLRLEYLERIGYTSFHCQVGYEADDIIAAIVNGLSKDDTAVIVSADQDLYQLLNRRVVFYQPAKKEIWDTKRFQEFTGIHPSQWAEAKAIAGCGTDDIPGVDGVATPTACKYLAGETIPKAKRALIEDFIKTDTYQLNLQLTALPFRGTDPIQLESGKTNFSSSAFAELCHDLTSGQYLTSDKSWRREVG